jgi:hypothetical protein
VDQGELVAQAVRAELAAQVDLAVRAELAAQVDLAVQGASAV